MGGDPVVQGVELPFISPGEVSQPPWGTIQGGQGGTGQQAEQESSGRSHLEPCRARLGRSDVIIVIIVSGIRPGTGGSCVSGRLRSAGRPVIAPAAPWDRAEQVRVHAPLSHDAVGHGVTRLPSYQLAPLLECQPRRQSLIC